MNSSFLNWIALSLLLHLFMIVYLPYIALSQDEPAQCKEIMEVGLVDKPLQHKPALKKPEIERQKPEEHTAREKKSRTEAPKHFQNRSTLPKAKAQQEDSRVPYEIEGHVNLDYMARMRRLIMTAWVYPDSAIAAGLEGKAKIAFEIDRTGRLLRQSIIISTGYKDLDRAALLAIKNASPFGSFPDDIPENTLKIKWYFQYKLD